MNKTCPPPCGGRHRRPKSAYCSEKCRKHARYLANRPARLAAQKAWREAHSEKVLEYRQNRAVRERALAKERELRARLRAEAALARPRCVICSDPLPWHKPSFPLSATTCGKRECAQKRWRWFGPRKPRAKVA